MFYHEDDMDMMFPNDVPEIKSFREVFVPTILRRVSEIKINKCFFGTYEFRLKREKHYEVFGILKANYIKENENDLMFEGEAADEIIFEGPYEITVFRQGESYDWTEGFFQLNCYFHKGKLIEKCFMKQRDDYSPVNWNDDYLEDKNQ